ncbi:hypothetical protein KR100_13880 [Synechococcus sp. KORDI-100]|nr:hypothetical protein KR100_13880 [Synechococcus sp. KORDI-100]
MYREDDSHNFYIHYARDVTLELLLKPVQKKILAKRNLELG